MMAWKVKEKKLLLQTVPFAVEELSFEAAPDAPTRPYHRLLCPDWVNVLPITTVGQAVLIRQPRAGNLSQVLETPGGVLDGAEGKDPTMAALRELEEETGYTSRRIIPLASVNPNPAMQNNKLHLFLALNCSLNPQRQHFPDADERIQVELHGLDELEELVRLGRIDHALSALCIMLALKYLPKLDETKA